MYDKTVVLNGSVVNFDGNVDYSNIASEVVVYDQTPEDKILERVDGRCYCHSTHGLARFRN
ncbi:hypothetical protein GCM10025857_64550 [Alicyclobacillus contaminans]|uniref:Uncharacterized protein n=1 Tax=Tetragenococcus osmophilus TaxID=526944 RepID=A0AA37XHQ7_9ENTE|nr:hypothetical protein GCM10025857_64550 [Alicyclobacillus contaminans]GMA71128.1 hypothetical protein GCM10025885_01770 [Tetragenococcus osmophilus]